ncbi:MAG: PIN domain-containing protein [Lachnospiraceae bacterium]|nr:PIN domain-containing protein [Lachnospiraceae bacterium]
MKVYLDNCCYNRPYDDQSQIRISLETQTKLYVQDLVKKNEIDLINSYVLWFENSQNPYETKRKAIGEFLQKNSSEYIDTDKADLIKDKAEEIMKTGIKMKDAYHVACAIYSSCDCFFTTDDRLLKYSTDDIQILNPIDFVRRWESGLHG